MDDKDAVLTIIIPYLLATAGPIPDGLSQLPYLELVDFTLTRMTCCPNQTAANDISTAYGVNALLPTWLQFDADLIQFDVSRGAQDDLRGANQPTDVL